MPAFPVSSRHRRRGPWPTPAATYGQLMAPVPTAHSVPGTGPTKHLTYKWPWVWRWALFFFYFSEQEMEAAGNLKSHLALALSLIPSGRWTPLRFTKPFPSQGSFDPITGPGIGTTDPF